MIFEMVPTSLPEKYKCSFFSTDPYQASHQPQLTLTGTPLSFNPAPKFVGETFDRTLSFGLHVHYLCTKFFSLFNALHSIASALGGPFKEFISHMYKAFSRLALSYTSPGWLPFLCDTLKQDLEVYHRNANSG